MHSKKLGRAAVAAGLLVLLAPGVAFASWSDGGYDGRPYDGYAEGGYAEGGYWSDYDAPPPPPPPAGPVAPIYGCENSDLAEPGFSLHKTTVPPPGTPVAPGDEILVDIEWDPLDWSEPFLHKALDCVYINGVFVPGLSLGEHDTPNDGHFGISYVVPFDAPIGGEICDQGFVSGPRGWEDYYREVSNVVCFPIHPPIAGPPPPPCCTGPPACCAEAPPPPPPPPPVEEPTTTTTTTAPSAPPEEEQPYIQSERLEQEVPPDTPGPAQPMVQDRQVLPRTGGGPEAARLAAGGLAVLALIRRRPRRG